jgi:hypothetical protein
MSERLLYEAELTFVIQLNVGPWAMVPSSAEGPEFRRSQRTCILVNVRRQTIPFSSVFEVVHSSVPALFGINLLKLVTSKPCPKPSSTCPKPCCGQCVPTSGLDIMSMTEVTGGHAIDVKIPLKVYGNAMSRRSDDGLIRRNGPTEPLLRTGTVNKPAAESSRKD